MRSNLILADDMRSIYTNVNMGELKSLIYSIECSHTNTKICEYYARVYNTDK